MPTPPQHVRHWWLAATAVLTTVSAAAIGINVVDDDPAGGIALPTTSTARPSPDAADAPHHWATTTTTVPPTTTTTTTAPPPPPPTTAAPPPVTAAPSPPSPPPPPPGAVRDSAAEGRIRSLLSGQRRAVGQPDLGSSGSLDAYAADWSRQMAEGRGLGHSPASHGAVQGVCGGCGSGENVGYGQDADHVWSLLLQSGGHRANIEKPGGGVVGIGAYRQGNLVWITMVFGYSG